MNLIPSISVEKMIADKIIAFLKADTNLKSKFPSQINGNTLLLKSGIIDSFEIIKLIIFLEETFNIQLDSEDLQEKNFYTLKSLKKLIINKQKSKKTGL